MGISYQHHIFSNVQCDSTLNVINISKVAKGGMRNLIISVSHQQAGLLKTASASSHPKGQMTTINKLYANCTLTKYINLKQSAVKSAPKLLCDD